MMRHIMVCGLLTVLLAMRAQAVFTGPMNVTPQNASNYGKGMFRISSRQQGLCTLFHVEVCIRQWRLVKGSLIRVSRGKTGQGGDYWVRDDELVQDGTQSRTSSSSRLHFTEFRAVSGISLMPHRIRGGVSFDFAVPTQNLAPTRFAVDIDGALMPGGIPMPDEDLYWLDLNSFCHGR